MRSTGSLAFDAEGALPLGLHWVNIREFRDMFGYNYHRSWLFEGFAKACLALRTGGCARVFVGGSYVTSKEYPADYDACWDPIGVSSTTLDKIFYDATMSEALQKKFRGEWFISQPGNGPESEMYRFLARDKTTGRERGMVGIKLNMIELFNL